MKMAVFSLLLVLCTLASLTHGCSFPRDEHGEPIPIRWYTIEETFNKAPVILYGKDIYHSTQADGGNYAIFEVYCVIKNTKNIPVSSNITIHGLAHPNSCDTDVSKVNETYIICLTGEKYEDDTDRYYDIFHPGGYNTGVFPSNATRLQTAADVCDGIGTITQVADVTCPTRTTTNTTCLECGTSQKVDGKCLDCSPGYIEDGKCTVGGASALTIFYPIIWLVTISYTLIC